jgi:hypothetical protein
LEAKDEGLLQDPQKKFSLAEMWEIAFHNLSRLQFRKAYVMIKGVLEHPELIHTLDTPFAAPEVFRFSDAYVSLEAMEN